MFEPKKYSSLFFGDLVQVFYHLFRPMKEEYMNSSRKGYTIAK